MFAYYEIIEWTESPTAEGISWGAWITGAGPSHFNQPFSVPLSWSQLFSHSWDD